MTFAAAGMLGLGGMAYADLKLGTINIIEIMRDSEAGKKATNEMEVKREKLTADIQKDEQAFTKAMDEYNNKKSMLSTDAREKEETRLMNMRNDLENKVKKSEDELKRAMQYASDNLSKQAQAVIEEYAVKNNYDLIQDTASGRVVYRADKTDLTKVMVANMDAANKKDSSDKKVQTAANKPAATKTARA